MKRRLQFFSLLFVIFSLQLKAQTLLDTAIDFTATDINGQQIKLFDILDGGQYVLIDFFYTTCTPCQAAVPKIKETYERTGCNQHEVFFMEITPIDGNSACSNWVNYFGIEYPTIGKEGGGNTICTEYGIDNYPTVILIAPDRSIVIKNIKPTSADELINALAEFGIEEHDCIPQPECEPATNLQAAIVGSGVELSWDAPTNEEQRTYTITRNGIEIESGITETFYTDEEIPNFDCAVEYCVTAVYANCISDPACTANNVAPVPPATTVQAVLDGNNVNVTWSAPSDKRTEDLIFFEDFEGAVPGSTPDNWIALDEDGDFNTWMTYLGFATHSGEKVIVSFSFNGAPLSPDNYLISPNAEGTTKVKFYFSVNDLYPADHYAVMVSSTGTNAADFTMVYEETPNGLSKGDIRLDGKDLRDNNRPMSPWFERTVEIPEGTKYVAFRHFNCYDENLILLDDISFFGTAVVSDYIYNVTRNGVEIATGITETCYTDNSIENGTYNYCVEVESISSGCTSNQACAATSVTVGIDNEVANSYKVYPNPAKEVIYIEGDVTNVVIYNSLGQVVRAEMSNGQIDISSLDNGIYYMTITGSYRSRSVEKVIIAK